MENTGNTITKEHQVLFQKIKGDILANRGDYVLAGRWADDYCSVEAYWRRRRDELKLLLRGRRDCGLVPHLYTEAIDRIKELRNRPEKSLFVRSAGIYIHWVEKYDEKIFLFEGDCRCILLLTWLLTDPDADKEDTGLCELAKCPWEVEPEWEGRSYNKDIWLSSSELKMFLEMAAVAFGKVVGVQETETCKGKGRTRNSMKAKILIQVHEYLKDKTNISKLPRNRWRFLADKFAYSLGSKNPGIALRNAYHRKYKHNALL